MIAKIALSVWFSIVLAACSSGVMKDPALVNAGAAVAISVYVSSASTPEESVNRAAAVNAALDKAIEVLGGYSDVNTGSLDVVSTVMAKYLGDSLEAQALSSYVIAKTAQLYTDAELPGQVKAEDLLVYLRQLKTAVPTTQQEVA